MTSINKYAGTITQVSGGKFRTFSNLNNMKNNDWNASAVSSDWIKGKSASPNRPSTLSFTNFNLNIPLGAKVTKVVVEYRHHKAAKSGTNYPGIGAPTISLLGVSGITGKGKAPTKDSEYCKKEFRNTKLTRNVVNNSNFGVKIDYPANTNANEGKLYITYVRIAVAFILSEYTVDLKKVEGGYNQEEYTVQASISNKNLTDHNPSCTITSPLGFTFVSSSGTGEITQVNSRTFTWNPKLSSKVGTSSIDLTFLPSVTYAGNTDTYTGIFTISENLNSASKNHTATITERPPGTSEDVSADAEQVFEDETTFEDTVQTVTAGDEFKFILALTQSEINQIKAENEDMGITNPNQQYFLVHCEHTLNDYTRDGPYYPILLKDLTDKKIVLTFTATSNVGLKPITVYSSDPTLEGVLIRTWKINIIPIEEGLENPMFTIVKLTDEEIARLGQGVSYIASTYLKLETSKTYVEQWYKNYRLGVFNNMISENVTITTETIDGEVVETITDSTDYSNLTINEVFENAEYWSDVLQEPNVWENVECEFTYNKNYPVYLVITSLYSEQNSNDDIQFITPCIVEESQYNGREGTGIYPFPLNSLISGDGEYAEIDMEEFAPIPSIVFHELPVDEEYGTNEKFAIRGVALTGSIEKSEDIVLHAKLMSPKGLQGERSIVLSDDDENFTIGGLGDLWGLSTFDFVDLEDWEVELSISNILNTGYSTFIFGNIQIIFFIEPIEPQLVQVKINEEDLGYYGAFVNKIEIPEGLNTDTGFIDVDGTDTNDAYRQNIREKEINLELSLAYCDIEIGTMMLQQLTKLLMNKRDKYNRPIPNRIESSHYPNLYWEYIIKSELDVEDEHGAYNVKATLTVPSGTAYAKKDTVTNTTGFVQGLAAVNPIIQVKPNNEQIMITEQLSNQKFTIKYDNSLWTGKIVEIDCINRIVLLKTDESDIDPVDISAYADKDVDWFNLYGEYNFSAVNCTLRTVRFTERW